MADRHPGYRVFHHMEDCARTFFFSDRASGLRAVLCVDDLRLGPAAGGIRTGFYESELDALDDARRLARAMTYKCALAGLDAGGAKCVVMRGTHFDREAAFEALGAFIEELGGMYRCAGDLGTTAADLDAVARHCQYVHRNTEALADAVARGAVGCIETCASMRGLPLADARIGIQGCGSIGLALAKALAARGARLVVADLDAEKVAACVEATGATVVDPAAVLLADVDILAPCASGGVITEDVAGQLQAMAVCGAANNILRSPQAGEVLMSRNILHVPDILASAGAVIDGIGETVMGLADRTPLIDGLATTAREVLLESQSSHQPAEQVALAMANGRLQGA